MANRKEQFDELVAKAGGLSALARATGITPGHLSVLKKRLEDNPNANVRSDTAAKLFGADASKWAVERTVERDEPNYVIAIEFAHASRHGVSDLILADARKVLGDHRGEVTPDDVRSAIEAAERLGGEAESYWAKRASKTRPQGSVDELDRAPVIPSKPKKKPSGPTSRARR